MVFLEGNGVGLPPAHCGEEAGRRAGSSLSRVFLNCRHNPLVGHKSYLVGQDQKLKKKKKCFPQGQSRFCLGKPFFQVCIVSCNLVSLKALLWRAVKNSPWEIRQAGWRQSGPFIWHLLVPRVVSCRQEATNTFPVWPLGKRHP